MLNNKCICFLNYIAENESFSLEVDQREAIHELINILSHQNASELYLKFAKRKDNIISLCQRNETCYKMEGVSILIDSFSNMCSLSEQFSLLREHCTAIFKTVLEENNQMECYDVYFKLGELMVTMLYSCKFKITADKCDMSNNRRKNNSQSYFVIETNDTYNITHNDYSPFMFLNNSLFELTAQKELLLKREHILSLCQLLLHKLSTYKHIFKLQYICYLLCKRIYLNFPHFQSQIEDSLCSVLTNLCHFTSPEEQQITIECKQFLLYLLSHASSSSLKTKIAEHIKSTKTSLYEGITYSNIDIEYDALDLNNFNLRIGNPIYTSIDAGDTHELYIEIEKVDSLMYIGFTVAIYDITFILEKYNEANGSFEQFMRIDKVACKDIPVKVIVYVKRKGVYKLIYDNSYSWLISKEIRHRLSVLRI